MPPGKSQRLAIPWAHAIGTDNNSPSLCARVLACRQFTPDCHSEPPSAGPGVCFAAGHDRFFAVLGMTCIGLVRRPCNFFRTEPKPMASHLMGARRRWLRLAPGRNGVAGRCREAPGKGVRPVRSRNGGKWREFRRITKRTQSCAKAGAEPVSGRISIDWLYRRLARLEQEPVSRVTANLPEAAINPRAGWTRDNTRRLAVAARPFGLARYQFPRGTACHTRTTVVEVGRSRIGYGIAGIAVETAKFSNEPNRAPSQA